MVKEGTRHDTKRPDQKDRAFDGGGDDRDRTDDLRRAKAALSQLSYVPEEMRLSRAHFCIITHLCSVG